MLRGLFLEDEVCDLCGNQLRHPNLVAFKDTMEIEEKGSITVYLITEPVKPLQMVLEDINLSGEHRSEELWLYLSSYTAWDVHKLLPIILDTRIVCSTFLPNSNRGPMKVGPRGHLYEL